MSNWPELLSEGQVVPWFQPIVSTETAQVTAYEALGRLALGDQVHSLGTFFHPAQQEENHPRLIKEIDRRVRKLAMTAFLKADPDARLFLNIRPSHMLDHLVHPEQELPWTLHVARELGLDTSRLVIELTEEAINTDVQNLKVLIDQYRAHGCTIAIDDMGAQASNLDRIGFFEPDIIKIDALILRRSREERSFREVLHGVSAMAEGLGASLLFEGVETEADVELALRFGARFIQGWVFAPARPEFVSRDSFQQQLNPIVERFGLGLGTEALLAKSRIRRTTEALGNPPTPHREQGHWYFHPSDLDPWTPVACRVFLTDRAGFQVSPNYEVSQGRWHSRESCLGRSRAMRPYFPGAGDHRWSVSDVYFDLNDRSLVRTYSRPLTEDITLFVDVQEIENRSLKR